MLPEQFQVVRLCFSGISALFEQFHNGNAGVAFAPKQGRHGTEITSRPVGGRTRGYSHALFAHFDLHRPDHAAAYDLADITLNLNGHVGSV